ncbi:MAG: 50S ribosomal protein L4 [Nitrospirae bacterium]|nr:50S ribosomal protein L4 [Nitrospirota bacterium]
MPEIEVKDRNNNTVEKITLNDGIFAVSANMGVIHEAIVNFLANQRQGTAATKTRGMVRGGGKKPWRQKHTGRARAGSIRSPLWRGGGTVFGPQVRDYSCALPKKQKRLALLSAINEKISNGEVVVIDELSLEKPKTKNMIEILKNFGFEKKSVLIVIPEKDDAILLSTRNIPGVDVTRVMDLNTYDVIVHDILLMTKDAIKRLEEIKG